MPPVVTADVLEWVSRAAPPCRVPETPLIKPAGGHRVLSARQRWYFYWQTDWNLALSRPGSGASSGQFFFVSRSCRTKQKVCWSMNHGVLQITELTYLCRTMWPAGCTGSTPARCTVVCPAVCNYLFWYTLSVNLLIDFGVMKCARTRWNIFVKMKILQYLGFLFCFASYLYFW